MKKTIIILSVLVLNSLIPTVLFAQITESELQLFVNENKDAVENQIQHIRDVYSKFPEFQYIEYGYSRYLLVNFLSNREENYLIDMNKYELDVIDSETQTDWISIMLLGTDTICCELDYFEYYMYNPSNPIVVINTFQGDYPEGFSTTDVEYYFFNDSLLFVFLNKEEDYFPLMANSYRFREERYYYLNDIPIRCLEKEIVNRDDNISSIPNTSMELSAGIEYYEKGMKLLKKMKSAKIYN